MALNREQKRALKKSGELGEDGAPAPRRSQGGSRSGPPPKDKEKRTGAREYLHEVRAEMRKVAWPNREETRNYSIIVLIALAVMTSFIFVIDLGFSDVVLRLFKAN